MDDDVYFQSTRSVPFCGTKIQIPNKSVDFLIHVAHMNFEPLHITLSELFYLNTLRSKLILNFVSNNQNDIHGQVCF